MTWDLPDALTTLRSLFSPHDLSFCFKSVGIKGAFVQLSPPVIHGEVSGLNGRVRQREAAFAQGLDWAPKEVNRIGQENVPFVNTPFLFYSRVRTAGAGCSALPAQSRAQQPGSELQFLNLAV